MKWTPKKLQPEPNIGDERRNLRFAWWPTTMSDGQVRVWLEHYLSIEQFSKRWMVLPESSTPLEYNGWKEISRQALYDL